MMRQDVGVRYLRHAGAHGQGKHPRSTGQFLHYQPSAMLVPAGGAARPPQWRALMIPSCMNVFPRLQVVQHEPVHYPPDVPISTSLRHVLDCMLAKVSTCACVCDCLGL